MMPVSAKPDISKALAIGGWMSEEELIWLAEQARRYQYIVEFGSLHGRSARAMADNLCEGGRIWCVDPWAGTYLSEDGNPIPLTTYVMPYFIKNLKDHIDAGRCKPVRAFSYSFSLLHRVDMVFIDGDHRYETVVKDIKKAYELLRDGGLICGHDYNHPEWPGVKKAVDEYVGKVQTVGQIWHKVKS